MRQEFFADLLSSAATKRDAKAYLTRLKGLKKHVPLDAVVATPSQQQNPFSKSEVNVGNLLGRARAVDESPVFAQYQDVRAESSQETEMVHVALVKIIDADKFSDDILRGIAQTLSQLSRLS